jgi:hypothetical protein
MPEPRSIRLRRLLCDRLSRNDRVTEAAGASAGSTGDGCGVSSRAGGLGPLTLMAVRKVG